MMVELRSGDKVDDAALSELFYVMAQPLSERGRLLLALALLHVAAELVDLKPQGRVH
jgi:hypothetical protein